MKDTFKQKLSLILGITFFLVIIGFAYSRSYTLIHGSKISLSGLIDGSETSNQFVTLKGEAKHALSLLVNGRTISIDENGNFNDSLLLLPGYNVITVESTDKFGHKDSKVIRSYYKVNNAPSVALGNK